MGKSLVRSQRCRLQKNHHHQSLVLSSFIHYLITNSQFLTIYLSSFRETERIYYPLYEEQKFHPYDMDEHKLMTGIGM